MSSPRITALHARAVRAPFNRPPVSASGAIEAAALVLIDLETDAGLTGRCYLFAFSEAMLKATVTCLEGLAPLVVGQAVEPFALDRSLRQRFRLLDCHGILGQALAGLDMAAWDIHAQAANLPLALMLGADARPIPAYNSCGLWVQAPDTLADEATALLDDGRFQALKMRIGRADFNADLAAVRAVRERLDDSVLLMSDFNQSLTVNEALARGRALEDEGLYWIEEPVRHDDFDGCARISTALSTPVQIGENLRSAAEMQQAIAAHAASFYMPDVQRIGGVSGWMKAATLAEVHSLDLSSHLFPEISVHLLAASPTCHWLEYVDWANPILAEPLVIENGHALIPARPGNGITWDEAAIARYALG
jgi:mandelate racemase